MGQVRLVVLTLIIGAAVALGVLTLHAAASSSSLSNTIYSNSTVSLSQNATCTAARVHVELSLLLYQRVRLVANAMGESALVNGTLDSALNLTITANDSLSRGQCLDALHEAIGAIQLEAETWSVVMSNATRASKVNYTCINLASLAEARLNTVIRLTTNSTIHSEAEALLAELARLNSTSCTGVEGALGNATVLLNETLSGLRGRLGNWLEGKVEAAALVYVSVGEYRGIGELASLNLTEYWQYIVKALESAMAKYAEELNETLTRLLASGNLTGLISSYATVNRLSTALTILSSHGVKVGEAWGICLNATSLINETASIYGELKGNTTELSLLEALIREVYLSYVNGSLSTTVNQYFELAKVNETVKLLRGVNETMSKLAAMGYLKWSRGAAIVAIPIPEPVRGLIERYLNLTLGNLTLSTVNLGLCNNAYNAGRGIATLKALNATSIVKLAYSLYLIRIYCPMALQYAQWALVNLGNLSRLVNSTQ